MTESTWFSGSVIHQPEVIFCRVIPERSWSLRQQLHGVGWQTDRLRQRCKSTIYIRVTNSSLKEGMHQILFSEILIKKLFFLHLCQLCTVWFLQRDFKTSLRATSDSDTLTSLLEDDTGKNSKHVRYCALKHTSLPWATTWRFESAEECHTQFLRQGLQVEKGILISFFTQQNLGPGVSMEPDVLRHKVGLQGWVGSFSTIGWLSDSFFRLFGSVRTFFNRRKALSFYFQTSQYQR